MMAVKEVKLTYLLSVLMKNDIFKVQNANIISALTVLQQI